MNEDALLDWESGVVGLPSQSSRDAKAQSDVTQEATQASEKLEFVPVVVVYSGVSKEIIDLYVNKRSWLYSKQQIRVIHVQSLKEWINALRGKRIGILVVITHSSRLGVEFENGDLLFALADPDFPIKVNKIEYEGCKIGAGQIDKYTEIVNADIARGWQHWHFLGFFKIKKDKPVTINGKKVSFQKMVEVYSKYIHPYSLGDFESVVSGRQKSAAVLVEWFFEKFPTGIALLPHLAKKQNLGKFLSRKEVKPAIGSAAKLRAD